MNLFRLESERFILREFSVDDAEDIFNLNADPDVVKYVPDGAFASLEEAKGLLANYDQYEKYGFGRWTVRRKEDNEYLGWCGLRFVEEIQDVDLGYRFKKAAWGQGVATETSLLCLEYAFTELNLNRIIGRSMPENKASIAVLKKLGMTFWKNAEDHGNDIVVYKIDREEFIKK